MDRFYSLALQHSCFNCINLLTYVYVYCIESLKEAYIYPPALLYNSNWIHLNDESRIHLGWLKGE